MMYYVVGRSEQFCVVIGVGGRLIDVSKTERKVNPLSGKVQGRFLSAALLALFHGQGPTSMAKE